MKPVLHNHVDNWAGVCPLCRAGVPLRAKHELTIGLVREALGRVAGDIYVAIAAHCEGVPLGQVSRQLRDDYRDRCYRLMYSRCLARSGSNITRASVAYVSPRTYQPLRYPLDAEPEAEPAPLALHGVSVRPKKKHTARNPPWFRQLGRPPKY